MIRYVRLTSSSLLALKFSQNYAGDVDDEDEEMADEEDEEDEELDE